MSAFQATFADFKLVKSRKQAQFVFEVPLENADAALKLLGGLPRPDQEAWVGVARIDPKAKAEAARDRRRFDDLTPTQQAGIRCGDDKFREFLEGKAFHARDEKEAADAVRNLCEVGSRADLVREPYATYWRNTERDFQTWLRFGNG